MKAPQFAVCALFLAQAFAADERGNEKRFFLAGILDIKLDHGIHVDTPLGEAHLGLGPVGVQLGAHVNAGVANGGAEVGLGSGGLTAGGEAHALGLIHANASGSLQHGTGSGSLLSSALQGHVHVGGTGTETNQQHSAVLGGETGGATTGVLTSTSPHPSSIRGGSVDGSLTDGGETDSTEVPTTTTVHPTIPQQHANLVVFPDGYE